MEIVKQPDFQVFASEAKSGEVLEFPNILRGWGVTLDQTQGKPPLEWMNDAFKRIDTNNLYHLQQGIPEWNKSIRYPVNAIVKHTDKVYLCLAENENNEPHLNSDKWTLYVKKATTSQAGIVQLSSTLTDREDLASTPKMVNDVNRTASTAQKTANTANDKANAAQTTANQAISAAATADSKAVQAQTRADSAYNLANSKQDKLTFSGTGNVARMSEVDKKRDLNDFVFNGGGYAHIIFRNGTEPDVRIERYPSGGVVFVHRNQGSSSGGNINVITLPLDRSSGVIALTSDIPSYKRVNVTSQRSINSKYRNNHAHPIHIYITGKSAPSGQGWGALYVGGMLASKTPWLGGGGMTYGVYAEVLPGEEYYLTVVSIESWVELIPE